MIGRLKDKADVVAALSSLDGDHGSCAQAAHRRPGGPACSWEMDTEKFGLLVRLRRTTTCLPLRLPASTA